MKSILSKFSLVLLTLAGLLLVALALPLGAFPPAPFHTLYGDVRDQYGKLLSAEGSSVILYQAGTEITRQSLTVPGNLDYNYQMRLRIDMVRPFTTNYSSIALTTGSTFTLAVSIGGQLFYPIEVAAPQTTGKAAARRRLNLTLGVDSDGDGLPDAWEEAQLYHAGILPGENGWDLSLIDREGDFDGDGVSNWDEYIAGTYATDRDSILALSIKEKLSSSARLEFYAFYGKSYRIESSTDLKTWNPIPVSRTDPAGPDATPTQASLTSTITGIMSVHADAPAQSTYYRLIAR
jgi:hypothetical protein